MMQSAPTWIAQRESIELGLVPGPKTTTVAPVKHGIYGVGGGVWEGFRVTCILLSSTHLSTCNGGSRVVP